MRGRRGTVPSDDLDPRRAEAYSGYVEHSEVRKRRWVLCIAGRSYPPKSSSIIFSGSTPRSVSIRMTAEFIIGGPHM